MVTRVRKARKVCYCYEELRATTRGLLWPVVWWAHLALASPVLALTLGGSGLAAGPILVVMLFRGHRTRLAKRAMRMKVCDE